MKEYSCIDCRAMKICLLNKHSTTEASRNLIQQRIHQMPTSFFSQHLHPQCMSMKVFHKTNYQKNYISFKYIFLVFIKQAKALFSL